MLAELVDDPARLEQVRAEWDELAVACVSPFSAPGWMLAWWRNAAPPGARLQAVLAFDGTTLVGVAPFFADDDSHRLLASGTSTGVEPLVRADRADAFAGIVAAELARAGAELVRFQGVGGASRWPRRLADAWPGRRPWLRVEVSMAAPSVTFDVATFEEWLATLNPKFRKNMRRLARRLEEQGAVYRLAGPDDVEGDLRAFAALHHARWAGKGGSGVLNAGVERMLAEAARELVPRDRLRLWSLEVGGRTIASELFVAAGRKVSSWLGGFDDEWAQFEPSKHLILREIEHAFADHAIWVDLGPGAHDFKLRFANDAERVEWAVLVPRGPAYTRTRLRLAPHQLRRAVGDRLAPERKRAVKRLLRMGPRG